MLMRLLDRLEEIIISTLIGAATLLIFVAVVQRYGMSNAAALIGWAKGHGMDWLAVAARSVDKDMGVVTIEMKTSFMQPARGPLVAKGRLIHRTASMAFAEGTVYDAEGRICSHATGTFKYVRRQPADAAAGPRAISTD